MRSVLSSGDGDGIDADANDPGKSFPKQQDDDSHGTHVAGTVLSSKLRIDTMLLDRGARYAWSDGSAGSATAPWAPANWRG